MSTDSSDDKKSSVGDAKTVGQRFTGKVAVVTGSSDGIGYGIAYRLAQEGAHVVISSRRKGVVDEAVKKIQAAGFAASGLAVDIIKASDRKLLIAHALAVGDKKRIDTLVNNVGVYSSKSLLETTSEEWDSLFDVNVKSAWELTKEAHTHIPRGGSITFIGSAVGYVPGPPCSLYAITKTLTLGVVAALSKELAPKGIRVNTLSPGPIGTPLLVDIQKSGEAGTQFIDGLTKQTTLKRIGTVEEIGASVAFLASDDAGYITGENITAGGGTFGARI